MLPPGLVYIDTGLVSIDSCVDYIDSWVDERDLGRRFQLMETEEPRLFDEWIANWSDLVDFEIVPVLTSRQAALRIETST